MDYLLLIAILTGIAVLLFLILRFKIHAFIALLIASIVVGVIAGMEPSKIMDSIKEGMANTLGFVATVIGLGAMFGAILEASGGAHIITRFLLDKLGIKRASSAMTLAGFIIAIPVFFDVAFILLIPILYSLQKQTKRSLLLFALPLLAGLAVTHAFIPPTPGPIAVADIIGARLGWVILIGALAGLPTAIIGGIFYGKYIGNKIFVSVPFENDPQSLTTQTDHKSPDIRILFLIIAIPIVLILLSTFTSSGLLNLRNETINQIISLIGHPFAALIIANIIAWYVLGIKQGFSKEELLNITSKSLGPAGMIILITGAGGVFKQLLINTGAGKMIAESLTGIGFPVILFAFTVALLVRIIQGSTTVAMITAAGLVSPVITNGQFDNLHLACIVIAIASGALGFSHVNDSGFWMVKQFIGLTEKQTFKTWTVMTGIISFSGLLFVSMIYYLFG